MLIRCNWCYKEFNEDEIKVINEEEFCPRCNEKEYLMDMEEQERECIICGSISHEKVTIKDYEEDICNECLNILVDKNYIQKDNNIYKSVHFISRLQFVKNTFKNTINKYFVKIESPHKTYHISVHANNEKQAIDKAKVFLGQKSIATIDNSMNDEEFYKLYYK